MEQKLMPTEGRIMKSYEKIYGEMNRRKAYGTIVLLAAGAVMCAVEPVFLGLIGFPLLMAMAAPNGLREMRKEFGKEAGLVRDAFGCIGRDLRRLVGREAGRAVEGVVVAAPASGGAESRSGVAHGVEPQFPPADGHIPAAPANSNTPAVRKTVA